MHAHVLINRIFRLLCSVVRDLAQYFAFYNAERPHQSLGYQTPDQVYNAGVGGGALIVDRFGDNSEKPQEKSNTAQRRPADAVAMDTA